MIVHVQFKDGNVVSAKKSARTLLRFLGKISQNDKVFMIRVDGVGFSWKEFIKLTKNG